MQREFIVQLLLWGIWLFIPTLIDVILGFYRAIKVMIINLRQGKKKEKELDYFPLVSVIIPVYNSEKTLKKCIESVINQSYSIDNLEIILVDNGSSDNSYSVFQDIQEKNQTAKIWWYKTGRGKAKALNAGIYYSTGKYIVNIDSDGYISEKCIESFVKKFESNKNISAMTGSVVIEPEKIKEQKGFFKKMLNKCEFIEYLEVFLIGRNNQSVTNDLFTMAGAVSAIKRDVASKSQMYNGSTLGEDAHMTQQIIMLQGGVVSYCKEAIFYTEPIDGFNSLCIQRERWQRGALEVAGLFLDINNKGKKKTLRKMLFSDHAMTFPKFIWIFAIFYLGIIGYPMSMLIGANIIIYLSYCCISLFSVIISSILLEDLKEIKEYLLKNILVFLLMPIYRAITLFFRVSGIINSLSSKSSWNARGIIEEFKLGIKAIFSIKDIEKD